MLKVGGGSALELRNPDRGCSWVDRDKLHSVGLSIAPSDPLASSMRERLCVMCRGRTSR